MSFARVHSVGAWSGFARSALRLAVVLCWADCCFESCVSLGLLCFLRVTQGLPVLNACTCNVVPALHHMPVTCYLYDLRFYSTPPVV